jgi:hypothetical protein
MEGRTMQGLTAKIAAYFRKKLDLHRRRKHKVKVWVSTTDDDNIIRDYLFVAVPRTLEKKEYDVRIKRQKRHGPNVEIVEHVWSREKLEEFVHENA